MLISDEATKGQSIGYFSLPIELGIQIRQFFLYQFIILEI